MKLRGVRHILNLILDTATCRYHGRQIFPQRSTALSDASGFELTVAPKTEERVMKEIQQSAYRGFGDSKNMVAGFSVIQALIPVCVLANYSLENIFGGRV